MQYLDVNVLEGKVLRSVVADGDSIKFEVDDNEVYMMEHIQDCCEHVYIESIVGDLQDLVGVRINLAEEVSNEDYEKQNTNEYEESCTWTFYKFGTIKGYVDIRWFGSSNGYYSESVDFYRTS